MIEGMSVKDSFPFKIHLNPSAPSRDGVLDCRRLKKDNHIHFPIFKPPGKIHTPLANIFGSCLVIVLLRVLVLS
jgi:hypothetical protein